MLGVVEEYLAPRLAQIYLYKTLKEYLNLQDAIKLFLILVIAFQHLLVVHLFLNVCFISVSYVQDLIKAVLRCDRSLYSSRRLGSCF